jgi:hypothetical protein
MFGSLNHAGISVSRKLIGLEPTQANKFFLDCLSGNTPPYKGKRPVLGRHHKRKLLREVFEL